MSRVVTSSSQEGPPTQKLRLSLGLIKQPSSGEGGAGTSIHTNKPKPLVRKISLTLKDNKD